MAINLEKALLGKISDDISIRECWDRGLRGAQFEDPFHRSVYEFALDYWMTTGQKTAPSREVLFTEFDPDDRGKLVLEESDDSLHWLIEKLLTRYRSNQVQEILRASAQLSVDDPKAALDSMYAEAWQAKEASSPRQARIDMATNGEQRLERYLAKARTGGTEGGAPIGLEEVDEHTGLILPGELGIAAAYTKTGKSFALVNALVAAHKAGMRPYVASLEQPVPEFEERIDAFYSGVGYGKIQRGDLTPEDVVRLTAAHEQLREAGPLHLERPEESERTAVNLVNRARQLGCNYLIIDQLSWLDAPKSRYNSERDRFKDLIYGLKAEISRTSAGAIPCFMAVQANRKSTETGERLHMSHIAEASHIEQTVDIAYGLWRNREMRSNNSMVIDILGSRRSDIHSWLLGWYLNRETSIYVRGDYTE